MSKFWVNTARVRPGLHVWRVNTSLSVDLRPIGPSQNGWVAFEYDFEPSAEAIAFKLFDFDAAGNRTGWEDHERTVSPNDDGNIPENIWSTEATSRPLLADPRLLTRSKLTVHLISQKRYRPSELFLWIPGSGWSRHVPMTSEDNLGPVFEFSLQAPEGSFFNLKFIRREGGDAFTAFEPDFANRLWCAQDGAEVWTHSEAADLTTVVPARKSLTIRMRQELESPAEMHVWQLNSDYSANVPASGQQGGWMKFETEFYTNMRYGIRFRNRELGAAEWEHRAAARILQIKADTQLWTLEGSNVVFPSEPQQTGQAKITVALRPPFSALSASLSAETRVDWSRSPLSIAPVAADGTVAITGYPTVRTVVRFRDSEGRTEQIHGHPVVLEQTREELFAVLERPPLLRNPPAADTFQDPPFSIRRPGVFEENGFLNFTLHAPDAARLDLLTEWTNWRQAPIPMHSTNDGAYWWTRIAKSQLLQSIGASTYHGRKYKFLFNETTELQDPAAGWMDDSWNSEPSKLIDHGLYQWNDAAWQRPGFDYYAIYQLHPARFSGRNSTLDPLRQVAREINTAAGYLRDLGITAILLLPLNEVGSNNGWGYDPAFFYGIEHSYGGPDALKELVDTCHQNGLAVLVDVVFNHAGSIDNILWSTARASFFDGDTAWGAMINFDHPQCRHFFAQNLVYLAREFHIDGFRLDHTYTILHSHEQNFYVREPGSGGGWEFMHELRRALHSEVGSRALLMAEHLPNEWNLTNFGGPMDTQWCDSFHDRLIEACKGRFVMSALADALRITHTESDDWYKATNYPESHDEVGNVPDRVANVAGWGRGLRMAKVAAAASLFARGIPMFFMGAEGGESAQFTNGSTGRLDLDAYISEPNRKKVRDWWKELLRFRRSPLIAGPSPLQVTFADGQMLAFTRGAGNELFVLLNFGGWSGWKPLTELNLPEGVYCEFWNSTWPAFAVESEGEDEHMNWGRDARLHRNNWLHIPDFGVIVLNRVG